MTTKIQADIDTIRENILALKNSGVVMADVARESGISASRLSQFLSGTYLGNSQTVANSLAAWLDNRNTRHNTLPVMPEFVETPTVKNIWSAFQYAQLTQSIAVVYGNPGLSKTTARDKFVASRPNVWTFTVSRSCVNVAGCLYAIAQAIGVKEPQVYRPDFLYRQVRDELKGKKGLIIVDEADRLGYETLEELRILQEESQVGLVLIGNHRVYKRLTGNQSRDVDFARLFSRIAKRVVIETATQADIDAIADACGLDNDARQIINWIARQPGALRMVFYSLQLASTKALAMREALTTSHIIAAIKDLGCEYKGAES
ncbi:AAA family ATPase [Edwardsiella piscicida]|uniref:AAA family ATPase n=1 Tax=Edwardsiella piscicida TaxID=1263550 RepID=UPI000D52447F|nr:AAA family ATPase [Edwardsiella piscicida]ELM3734826.1 AAA family ATPase [Edwardsiella piscicida]QBB14213.1 DNA transposition protein [Edwardsiella piscicida]UCQ39649.1 AAA family ATPase [Edwardsiella piscicida]WGS78544.1 AAA family ATPase [Edwardsiella piscicida]WGS81929.1 AAA family ATPase [Edwardsiella piscicida]